MGGNQTFGRQTCIAGETADRFLVDADPGCFRRAGVTAG